MRVSLFVSLEREEGEEDKEAGEEEREVETERGIKFLYKKLYYLMINKINVFI